jgi:hypothetical protein
MTGTIHINGAVAAAAVQAYNRSMYRGSRNVDIDARAYTAFAPRLSYDTTELIEQR